MFVEADLHEDANIEATRQQANYLLSVLRMQAGEPLLLFNGRDGEWLARVQPKGRKACSLRVEQHTRPQTEPCTLVYCFAPLRRARLDYMVQKSVEMGTGVLQPVLTEHTQVMRINEERMRANAIEAAEQCGILSLPRIRPLVKLAELLEAWPPSMPLVFCDENASGGDNFERLAPLRGKAFGLLVGPEGGLSPAERETLLASPFVVPVSLGPRILRADTAAVAGLAIAQMVAGDWTVGGRRREGVRSGGSPVARTE